MPTHDVVIIVKRAVEAEQESTTLTLCTPYSTIESLRGKLATGFQSTRLEVDSGVAKRIEHNLYQTTANLSVELARGTIKARDVISLQSGDMLTLDTNPSDEALLMIEGTPKYYSYVGSYRGNRAARITRDVPKRDMVNYRNKQELLKNGG